MGSGWLSGGARWASLLLQLHGQGGGAADGGGEGSGEGGGGGGEGGGGGAGGEGGGGVHEVADQTYALSWHP